MRYLFYRFYRAALFIRKGGDPDIRAWLVLSGFMSINFYSIQQLYISLFDNNKIHLSTFFYIIIVLAILVFNYFMFLHQGKSEKIIDKYNSESKRSRMTGTIIGYLYVIVTLVLMLYAKHLQFN